MTPPDPQGPEIPAHQGAGSGRDGPSEAGRGSGCEGKGLWRRGRSGREDVVGQMLEELGLVGNEGHLRRREYLGKKRIGIDRENINTKMIKEQNND